MTQGTPTEGRGRRRCRQTSIRINKNEIVSGMDLSLYVWMKGIRLCVLLWLKVVKIIVVIVANLRLNEKSNRNLVNK